MPAEMAKLYFKYGAMGSSKTAQALITKFNYEERGMDVWLFEALRRLPRQGRPCSARASGWRRPPMSSARRTISARFTPRAAITTW